MFLCFILPHTLARRLNERLEGVWDIPGSKHTKSVYPALFPLEILGFANKGHITHYRAQDSGTAVGGGGFCCHLRRDLHTLVSKGMRYMNPECPEIQPGLQKTKCELH